MINVFKLDKQAKLPTRAHPYDAGLDLYAVEDVFVPANSVRKVPTGVAVEVPRGKVGLVCARSSMASKGLITGGGVIDAHYTGDLSVMVFNISAKPSWRWFRRGYWVRKGDKVAQLLMFDVVTAPTVETTVLWESDRGSKGFGSSGR